MMLRLTLAAALVAGAASGAGAQVGYTPAASPYRDLEFRQEATVFSGYYAASRDRAGVAPRSGPMVGALYAIRVGGPAELFVRGARVFSDRQVINPAFPAASRVVGTETVPLYLADLGLALNLTGQKSLHHVVPVLTGGLGLVSDFSKKPDVGGFDFGTSFAFSFGAGIRYVPGGRFQVRADVNDYVYNIDFPGSYSTPASDKSVVLGPGQTGSQYRHNAAVTIGASYLFFR